MTLSISALTATPVLAGAALQCIVTDTLNDKGPSYLRLDQVEFHAASTNDRSLAAKVGEGKTSAFHMGQIEGSTFYYWARPRYGSGEFGDWFPSSPTGGVQSTVGFASGNALVNGKIVASVGSNALTVAVKTTAGNDPSATNPVWVSFQNADGTSSTLAITSGLSAILSNGSDLSTANNTPFKLWAAIFNDGNTPRLALSNRSNAAGVSAVDEARAYDAIAEGGAGGADALKTWYAAVTISAKRLRLVSFLEWSSGLATAGAWSAGPDLIHIRGPGTKLPGEMVQQSSNFVGGYTSFIDDIPFDNTVPQETEGSSFFDTRLTPTSTANLIMTEFEAHLARSTAGPVIASIIKTGTADALVTDAINVGADSIARLAGKNISRAGSTSEQIFKIEMGATGGATVYRNGNSGGALLGGAMRASLFVSEISA